MSETSLHRRRGFFTPRLLAGFAPAPAVLALALAVAACLLVCGCSPGVDYPSIFPAIHDMPPPRADAPMDPNQLQQATEDLITDRNHLNAEMQNNGPGKTSTNPPGNTKDSAKSPPPAKSQPAAAAPGSTQGASGVAGAQTAGAETK
jgi:hypothetical protein